jgi:GAF domain-containing protein
MTGARTDCCSLDEIIVSPGFASPQQAERAQCAQTEAVLALSSVLANSPDQALQRLVELAMEGIDAESCGISLEEKDEAGVYLRWIATAGEFSRYVNGTMPREFSPCGTAIDLREPLVMRSPVRYYAYISQLHAPVRTVLLVPFARGGKLVGTVWAGAHTQDRTFTYSDLRFVQHLANFASDVLDAFSPLQGDHR